MKIKEIISKDENLLLEIFKNPTIQHSFSIIINSFSINPLIIGNSYHIYSMLIGERNPLFILAAQSFEQINNIQNELITLNSTNQIFISPESQTQYLFLDDPTKIDDFINKLKLTLKISCGYDLPTINFVKIPEMPHSPRIS